MTDLFDIQGKCAIVTGGAGDLGRAIAEGFLEAGAKVVLMDISERMKDIADAYRAEGYEAWAVIGNLGDSADLERMFYEALELLGGKIDILVNSAGIQYLHDAVDYPAEAFERILNINVKALFHMSQLAATEMMRAGSGKIINLASAASFFGAVRMPAYASSKGAVAQLTKALGNEWGGRGINVNALAPGHMDTKINTAVVDDPVRSAEVLKRVPLGRFGKPADVKGPALFLASHASDYLSGAIIPVDGGYLTR